MENKIDFIGQMDILTEDFEKELDNLINPKILSEMTLEELRDFERKYASLKDLNDELFSQMEENKNDYDEAEIEMTMDVSRELNDRVELKLAAIREEASVKEFDLESQEKTYVISDEVMNLFLKNSSIKQTRKDELRSYSSRDLTKEEYDKFIDLAVNTLVHLNYKNSKVSSGIIMQNVLYNFDKNERTDKLKSMLKDYNGRSLTKSELESVRRRINEFISPTPTFDYVSTPSEEVKVDTKANIDNKKTVEHQEEIKVDSDGPKVKEEPQKEETETKEDVTKDEEKEEPVSNEEQKDTKKPEVVQKPNNTIEAYINKGILPNNIDKKSFIKICNQLGFYPTDFDYVLDNTKLERLTSDKVIQIALNNQKAVKSHMKKIRDYQTIIDKYKGIIALQSKAPFSREFIDKIKANIKVLEKRKKEYELMVRNIKYDSISEAYNSKGSGLSNIDVETYDKISSRLNERLKEEYAKYDSLSEERKKALSKYEQKKIERRMSKLEDRINNLKEKQGKIVRKQIKVVNENVFNFISNVQYKQNIYATRQEVAQRKADKIVELEENIMSAESELSNVEHDLAIVDGDRLRDKLDRFGLNHERNKLEKRIESLRNKQGRVDLNYQISQSFVRHR